VVADADVEHLGHVRVREVRGEPRLVEEHLDELLLLAQMRKDALDRDALLEPLDPPVLGDVHLGHAARREALDDLISLLLVGFRHAPRERTTKGAAVSAAAAPARSCPAAAGTGSTPARRDDRAGSSGSPR